MKKAFPMLIIFAILITGCSMKIVPEQVDSGAINTKDNSLTLIKNDVSITVAPSDFDTNSYNLEGTVSAFDVKIVNLSNKEESFGPGSFLLVDNDGRQYYPLTPEKIKEMLTKDSYYLIPYPYVGFYYLEDYEKSSFFNNINSPLPYFYEVYPQDIFTRSLPAGAIIPKANVEGLVFFKIDLTDKKKVTLLVYDKDTLKSLPPDYSFPFKIEK